MNNLKSTILAVAKFAAKTSLKQDVNHATCTFFYQPKVPAALSNFKKKRYDLKNCK